MPEPNPRALGVGDSRGITIGLKDSQIGFFGKCEEQQSFTSAGSTLDNVGTDVERIVTILRAYGLIAPSS